MLRLEGEIPFRYIPPRTSISDTIDAYFQSATVLLKIPHSERTSNQELFVAKVGRKQQFVSRVGDKDLGKCTYWQTPILTSETEAKELNLALYRIQLNSYLSAQSGDALLAILSDSLYINPYNLVDVKKREPPNGQKVDLPSPQSNFVPLELSGAGDFRRRYGGVYVADIPGGVINTEAIDSVLGALTPEKEFRLIGGVTGIDLTTVSEFVFFSYGSVESQSPYWTFEANSMYEVFISYPVDSKPSFHQIELSNSLADLGFKGDWVADSNFSYMFGLLAALSPQVTKRLMQNWLDTNREIINNVVKNDGILSVWPGSYNSRSDSSIKAAANRIFPDSPYQSLRIDAGPWSDKWSNYYGRQPIFIFMRFPDKFMKTPITKLELVEKNGEFIVVRTIDD